jgi:hypothetical protein
VNSKQQMGFVGSALLFVAVFLPIASVPIYRELKLFSKRSRRRCLRPFFSPALFLLDAYSTI